MDIQKLTRDKRIIGATALVLIVALGLFAAMLSGRSGIGTRVVPTPTPQVLVQVVPTQPPPTSTPVPSTSTPEPTNTVTITVPPTVAAMLTEVPTAVQKPSDSGPNPAATEGLPAPTFTPKPATAAKKKSSALVLPNGVVYGDHTPSLPDRIVRIASPNIKLDAKVYEVYAKNGEWEVADYAAGHNYNSANPGEGGNIVLAGHNNWRGEVFRYLEFLKPGNEIDVWTLEGKEYKYQVQNIQKLKEAGAPMAERIAHGHVMDPTPYEQLTLITCWPYTTFTHRLIVTATPLK